MKLGPDMYHLNTFNKPKHEGVNKWTGVGCIQKITRKCHEIKRISTFASSKTNSDNAKEKGIFYCHLLHLLPFFIFLHITSFLCSILFCKILQHPKINPGLLFLEPCLLFFVATNFVSIYIYNTK